MDAGHDRPVLEDLEPLLGKLPPPEMAWIQEGVAEAERRFSALVGLLEDRTGLPFRRDAPTLWILGPRRPYINGYAPCADDQVSIDVDDGGASSNVWPPWVIWTSVQVKCDKQPPRRHYCFHGIVEVEREVATPRELVSALLDALDRVRDAITGCSRSQLVEFQHEGEPMPW